MKVAEHDEVMLVSLSLLVFKGRNECQIFYPVETVNLKINPICGSFDVSFSLAAGPTQNEYNDDGEFTQTVWRSLLFTPRDKIEIRCQNGHG